MEQVVNKELLENYKKALSQKYSAVCLDIDGTITMDKSKRIDKRAIKYRNNCQYSPWIPKRNRKTPQKYHR